MNALFGGIGDTVKNESDSDSEKEKKKKKKKEKKKDKEEKEQTSLMNLIDFDDKPTKATENQNTS